MNGNDTKTAAAVDRDAAITETIDTLMSMGIRWIPGTKSFDVLRELYNGAFTAGRNYEQTHHERKR